MLNLILIIEGCRRQKAGSQKILYEHFYAYVFKIAFRYVYHHDTAVNVTNDAFVKAFRNMERFRYQGHDHPRRLLMAWLKRIVINTAIDELRKNNMVQETGGIPAWVWEEADQSWQPDRQLLFRELIAHIKELPPIYRVVFNMYVIDGCTHEEIAEHLNISSGTSRSNLFRARVILQRIIKKKDNFNLLESSSAAIPVN